MYQHHRSETSSLIVSCEKMGIDLYYSQMSPPCRAVEICAANIGIQLNNRIISLLAGEHLRPEFLKVNPQHTVPVLDDNGFILTESRAIMQYLANAYAKNDTFYPKITKKRAIVDQMLLFDMGTLYKAFAETYMPIVLENQRLNLEKVEKFNEALGYLERHLKQKKYTAGDSITLADFTIMTTLCTAEASGHDLNKFVVIRDYMKRCKREMKGYDVNEKGAKVFGDMVKRTLANLDTKYNGSIAAARTGSVSGGGNSNAIGNSNSGVGSGSRSNNSRQRAGQGQEY